jgi:cytochrome c553
MPDPKKVFVVHGRNHAARSALFAFLRAIGLEPIEWGQAVSFTGQGSPYIGDVLEQAFAEAQAVVVLLTGDDVARLRHTYLTEQDPPYERALTPQARPNVLFEAGLAFGRHPERTILVSLGESRPFSDIAGRHTVHLRNGVPSRQQLADRLTIAGCAVDMVGKTDWHSAGDFQASLQTRDTIIPSYLSRILVVPLSIFILIAIFSYVLFTRDTRSNPNGEPPSLTVKPGPSASEPGKKLYEQFCASCHGQSGRGDGPAAAALNPKPHNHTDKATMSKLSDDELFKVIKNGGASVGKSPLMPPWGASLKDDQIKEILAYIRTLCCQ